MINIASWNIRGLNFSPKQSEVRHVISENNLSICVILETHVVTLKLQLMCSHIFRHWDWTSNGSFCSKGTRIILAWNHNDVDIVVLNQDDQAIHTSVWLKLERKELFCDFNDALFLEDVVVGASSIDIDMREFKECVEEIEVMDVQRSGLQFTWTQKPKGKDGALKKIDRIMANLGFSDVFVGAHAVFKPYRVSDHVPFVLFIPTLSKTKPKPFKFYNILTGNDRFREVVTEGWSNQFSGFLMFKVVQKLKCLKKPFRKLLYEKGNLHTNVVRLRDELDNVQTRLDVDPFNSCLHEEEARVVVEFNEALIMQKRSRIDNVTSVNGTIFENEKVVDAFVAHYSQFFEQAGITESFNTSQLFTTRVDDSDASYMVHNVMQQEVKDALFSMGNDKAPGPDGYTTAFFKEAWGADDVTNAVREFFTNGKLLKELNHMIIALILKNQSAFVPGPSISDNILLIQELMHNYHLDRGVPRCAFKVDIQKAYDTVDWLFLREVLVGFGFHERMIAWIMECVTTSSFSICINGSLHGYFKGKRGLRRVRINDSFTYHRYCSELELINLCFVDDLFLFVHGDVQSASTIKEALEKFKEASGLVLSLPKSTSYFCNVLNHTKLVILNVLPFDEGRLPIKYLGVPLVSSWLLIRDCKELFEKVQSRIMDWKNKSLSIALLSLKESLWVRWVHAYKLKGRSFRDIPPRGNMSWGWRKILQLRPIIPASISTRDMFRTGLNPSSKLRDIIFNGAFSWPPVLSDKYSFLQSIIMLNVLDRRDLLEWRNELGLVKPFSVSMVWSCIRPRGDKVSWFDVVWFSYCIPRHAVNLWLIMKQRLKTQDKLSSWDVSGSHMTSWSSLLTCNDSLKHLFFECTFSMQIWSHMSRYAGMNSVGPIFTQIVSAIMPFANRKSSRSVIAKLVLAACAYFVWQERNERLFKNSTRSVKQVIDCIMTSVRLKMLTCQFRRTKDGVESFERVDICVEYKVVKLCLIKDMGVCLGMKVLRLYGGGKVKVLRVLEMMEHDSRACIYGTLVSVDTCDILLNDEFPILDVWKKIISKDNGRI
ncbi:hypothetical protein Tco_0922861 [Tanacetum coccineum]|uniref:Reverse transcriptase domain-containing protein n=1 Tax=Tanacetum coccineum TaxID=301880 RepID=A0ABQ5D0N7_9ASTR